MKKLLITATAMLVSVGVFAQGKLSFQNNINQLIYFTTENTQLKSLLPGDAGKSVNGFALAGSTLSSGASSTISALAGGPSLTFALFAGATAGSLAPVATTTMGNAASGGLLTPLNVTFASLPAGTAAFFNLEVFDSRATDATTAWASGYYAGQSGVFSAVPSAAAYSPMWNPSSPVNSTMPVGTYVPADYVGYAGYAGSIEVYATVVPEPATFALVGLGLATLLALRRRS